MKCCTNISEECILGESKVSSSRTISSTDAWSIGSILCADSINSGSCTIVLISEAYWLDIGKKDCFSSPDQTELRTEPQRESGRETFKSDIGIFSNFHISVHICSFSLSFLLSFILSMHSLSLSFGGTFPI